MRLCGPLHDRLQREQIQSYARPSDRYARKNWSANRQHQYKQLFDHRKLHGHPSCLDEKDRRIIEAIFPLFGIFRVIFML
jgi:hypothetical protein